MQKKAKKVVQCDQCDSSFHFKCGSIFEPPGKLKWICPNFDDKSTPILLQEVRVHEFEHAYLLLSGECATYKNLYNDINQKNLTITQELDILKSKPATNNLVMQNMTKADLSNINQQMLLPALKQTTYAAVIRQKRVGDIKPKHAKTTTPSSTYDRAKSI